MKAITAPAFPLYNVLSTTRIFSIDAMRGITIMVMIFVNELAGVQNIPEWMKHAAADADAMTFVDVVFPAFLFIVGMSIPFAINNRLKKGDSLIQIIGHILVRTSGLLILGVFMVNAEGGYNKAHMPISIALWSFLFYICAILIWNVYHDKPKWLVYTLRITGIVGLIILASVYKGGDDGTTGLTPQWWGILGLIGWAYFISCLIFLACRGNLYILSAGVIFCTLAFYSSAIAAENNILLWIANQKGHATHTAIVLTGIILSLIFFDERIQKTTKEKFIQAFSLMIVALIMGVALRSISPVSKIYATPPWAFFCIACCIVLFCLLYWFTDLKKNKALVNLVAPAASNPLLAYIIPPIIYAIMTMAALSWPSFLRSGFVGIVWCIIFSFIVLGITALLNKAKIRLHL